jgi:hypothetical protein
VDLIYALVAILVVIGVYLVVTYISYLVFEMPFAVFTFVLMLVIITHSLYEWGASTLDRLFFRRHARQLRANLRALAQEAESYDAETMMAAIVRALCEALGYAHGWIVVAEPTGLCTVVAYPAGLRAPDHPSLPKVPEEAQAVDEGALAGTGLDAAIIAPLFAGGESLGSIILAQRAGPARWDEPRQLELLETVADRVASAIIVERQRQAYAQQIELAVRAFQERERALRQGLQAALAAGSTTQRPGPSAVELRPGIEDALRHLYDYAYLGELELAELEVVEAYVRENVQVVTNLDRGRALSQMVIDVIGKLRPPGPVPQPLTREWEQYTILYDAYVEGALNREIMAKLYVSESSFNRARRRAVRGIARAVAELERAALQSSP